MLSSLSVGQIGGGDSTPLPDSEMRKLCLSLKSSFSSEDWNHFKANITPVRLGFFLENDRIKNFLHTLLSNYPSAKNRGRAMTLKNAGNKAFGSGENKLAFEWYTKCLALMPHEEDAAIVYANRSAALFHLAQFSLAERDAELAFQFGYPPELHYKLYERLARCCMETGRTSLASKHLQKAIQCLSQAKGLDETKVGKTRSALETLLKTCSGKSSSFSSGMDNISSSSSGGAKLPEVVGGRSKYLRACSKRLVLKSNEKKGRFVVANEPIRPGDVIAVEKAYVSVLLPQHYHLQCFQCYSPLKAPIACKSCIYVSYCSTKCQKLAWKTHHQYECSILGALKHAGISVICFMALRILTQADPKQVLKWYDLIAPKKRELSTNEDFNSSGTQPDKLNGSVDISTEEYKTDHTAIFQLVTHLDRRSAESDFHQVLMAAYLLNILKNTAYFGKVMEGTNMSAGEAELKISLVLHRCLQFLQFNTHETSGWAPDLVKDNSVGLGGALFPTLAMFNHSCNPAIVRYFINDTVVVRTVRTIRPGEEVTENYGPCFITHGKSERKATLWEQFWFECECVACTQDWSTFDKLSNDGLRFRCEHCGAFVSKMDESLGLLFKCGRCTKPVNILKSLKSLQESESKYKQAMEFFETGDESNGLGILLENIALLDRYLMAPYKDLHMCQEHVRKCFLNLGNQITKLGFWEPEKV
ncbi:SET and MYND domain-containing protein 4 [Orchesella cincta]|uniref:Protein-lysine N-methyltransferase SMYD4 n=1 Tax=Orchesella cincta TaxID=48709 RepID=A0A1D2NDA3_ORCCI|nr:SET and MYND domain-containing protein 4 [Orchesella cincta]